VGVYSQNSFVSPCLGAELNRKTVFASVDCIASAHCQVKETRSQLRHRWMIPKHPQYLRQAKTLKLLQGGRLSGAHQISRELNGVWFDHESAILVSEQHGGHSLNSHVPLRRSYGVYRVLRIFCQPPQCISTILDLPSFITGNLSIVLLLNSFFCLCCIFPTWDHHDRQIVSNLDCTKLLEFCEESVLSFTDPFPNQGSQVRVATLILLTSRMHIKGDAVQGIGMGGFL
jgi:hypothetical protein